MTKVSTSTSVGFDKTGTGTGTRWTLLDNDWSKSWFTYDVFGGTAQASGNFNNFYVTETPASTVDGTDNGGVPVWDATTEWNGFSPFIFGKIAEPAVGETLPKTIYHEFKARLYVADGGTTYNREMIYRFNMKLAGTIPASAKRKAMPRRQHDI